jgi:polynucleotide 5'-kinase involved in rRNA processing
MNGAIMKTLYLRTPLIALLLIIATALIARGQDSRIQLSTLDHLAAKASQTVDVSIDERLIRIAAKVFKDNDAEEKQIKDLLVGIKGIYVKSFQFDTDGQIAPTDLESIRTQLRAPGWSRLLGVKSRKEGNFDVYLLMNAEQVGGLAVLHTDQRELTVVNIVGPVDLDKLAKLEGQLGIPDLEIQPSKPKPKNDEK